MKRIGWMAMSTVAILFLRQTAPLAMAQCAMCRTGLMNSPEGQQLIAGFNSGILLLLAVPLGIFLGVVFMLWHAARKRSLAEPRRLAEFTINQ